MLTAQLFSLPVISQTLTLGAVRSCLMVDHELSTQPSPQARHALAALLADLFCPLFFSSPIKAVFCPLTCHFTTLSLFFHHASVKLPALCSFIQCCSYCTKCLPLHLLLSLASPYPSSSFISPSSSPFCSPSLPVSCQSSDHHKNPPPLHSSYSPPGPAWGWGGSRGEGGRWWRWVYWWWGWLWARAADDAVQPACQSAHSGSCPVSPPGGSQVVQQGLRTYMHMSVHTQLRLVGESASPVWAHSHTPSPSNTLHCKSIQTHLKCLNFALPKT